MSIFQGVYYVHLAMNHRAILGGLEAGGGGVRGEKERISPVLLGLASEQVGWNLNLH